MNRYKKTCLRDTLNKKLSSFISPYINMNKDIYLFSINKKGTNIAHGMFKNGFSFLDEFEYMLELKTKRVYVNPIYNK